MENHDPCCEILGEINGLKKLHCIRDAIIMETIRVGLREGESRTRTEMKTLPLPHDLIFEILLKLPVKSVLRFRCVCKSWFSLISDPNFAKSHFHLAPRHTSRILYISISPHKIESIDFEASLKDLTASLSFDFPLPQSEFRFIIKASCRGFIFLRTSLNIYIWNPSTGIHKEVPLSPFESKLQKAYYSIHLYGFGYDESNDDYVVVVLSCDRSVANASSHLEVFSFRDNRWREIEGTYLSYFNAFGSRGWLCNGAFHWLTSRFTFTVDVIVAFDIAERKLLEIRLPDDFVRAPSGGCGFWDFGEFLSLWTMDYDTVNIWVMKEYKVHSSWTKTHVLAINEIPFLSVICSTKSGDIIATDGGIGFLKYNNEGEFIEHISYCDQDGGIVLASSSDLNLPSVSEVITYTESLLSLPGENEQV